MAASDQINVRYAVPRWSPAWAVPEVPVPEAEFHDLAIEYIRGVLLAWIARTGLEAKVYRNLGIRWVPSEPLAGFDPDICLVTPPPPSTSDEFEGLSSLRLWEAGHSPPKLAIEIVSKGHPYKDYGDTPDRCAACGVQELWIYDPCGFGRRSHGGPHVLQVWRRGAHGFERRYAGDGPARSEVLDAWLFPTRARRPADAQLRIADEREPASFWPTHAEQQAQGAETRARQAEAQRRNIAEQERDALAREVAELRQRLKQHDG